MEVLRIIADYAGDICQVLTLSALLIKPVRERLFETEKIREGQRCLLRKDIVEVYYAHKESKQFQEYEFKHLSHCYDAYKALGGNHFIDHIYAEMQEWEII